MGGKKKYIEMFGSFTEPFYWFQTGADILADIPVPAYSGCPGKWPLNELLVEKSVELMDDATKPPSCGYEWRLQRVSQQRTLIYFWLSKWVC